jgi:hypothetical protein
MLRQFLFAALGFFVFISCDDINSKNNRDPESEYAKIDRQRCSFVLPGKLYLGKIDSSFNEEGYFRILSRESENRMQMFVYDSQIDIDERVNAQMNALNSPDVFSAKTIERISRFGNYQGKGVIMKGTYTGGVIQGKIRVFCYSTTGKGFLVIQQTIKSADTANFALVEKSFLLK